MRGGSEITRIRAEIRASPAFRLVQTLPSDVLKETTMHQPDYLLARIRGEFAEMPGMRLTFRQAQRLWALDAGTCRSLLDTLVERHFLVRSADGAYARATADPRTSRTVRFVLVGD